MNKRSRRATLKVNENKETEKLIDKIETSENITLKEIVEKEKEPVAPNSRGYSKEAAYNQMNSWWDRFCLKLPSTDDYYTITNFKLYFTFLKELGFVGLWSFFSALSWKITHEGKSSIKNMNGYELLKDKIKQLEKEIDSKHVVKQSDLMPQTAVQYVLENYGEEGNSLVDKIIFSFFTVKGLRSQEMYDVRLDQVLIHYAENMVEFKEIDRKRGKSTIYFGGFILDLVKTYIGLISHESGKFLKRFDSKTKKYGKTNVGKKYMKGIPRKMMTFVYEKKHESLPIDIVEEEKTGKNPQLDHLIILILDLNGYKNIQEEELLQLTRL